ncbi:hypothetical protein [Alkalihalobacillus sp. BA299]|uniref:homocitrate synthase/isopropylmalate synthase family protein n=1 Tax=Alkalihalobacillus sp. BA299 TaxID=2815938 RepID=UPI001ADD258D|nr:hypothetical protein [Alkalihalobacillus sp. BA299]
MLETQGKGDLWNVSKINFIDEIAKQFSFSNNIIISDCTLRDGEQQAGVVFTKQDKIEIAKMLDELGVHEIESGMPAVSMEDREAIETISSLGLKAKLTALSRAKKEDIDIVAETGVWGISISLPIGDLQREHKLKMTKEEYIKTCLTMTEYAKKKGLFVILSPYDTTRVEQSFLEEFLNRITDEQTVDRIRLVDTVGSAHPLTIKYIVKKMKGIIGELPIEVHTHNDFGLATANTLAALEAGAEIASVTLNGIGERSGNCSLEEVVVALKVLYGIDIGIQLDKLKEVSKRLELISNIQLQPHKAVVGENSFQHESGMIVAGLLKNSFTAEPYVPELVGQKRNIVIGKKTGFQSLAKKLEEMNVNIPVEQIENLLPELKSLAISKKRALTDHEIRIFFQDNKS